MENQEGINEQDLLLQLRQGDESAFNYFYKAHSNRIYGKLLKLTKSAEVAEELLQDVFMRIWEKREGINPALSFKAYLFRIAEHLVSDHFRQAAKNQVLYDQLLQGGTAYFTGTDEAAEEIYEANLARLEEAIDQLPPKRREIYRLCKLEGKSYQEAAEKLNISPATVSNQMTKANQFIQNYISNAGIVLLVLEYCLTHG
ncbi:RNA polymerase sigma-70 factor, ECF subfamily [bacterium A37T11]|nr:RNA polymerase sigma-70 factor, ECF subfamily [bacterium A37T11]